MPINPSEQAMRDFILVNKTNFHTAALIYRAFPHALAHLVAKIASRIEQALSNDANPGWAVTYNTLQSHPENSWSSLVWAPEAWRQYRWGIAISAGQPNGGNVIFGLLAIGKDTPGRNPAKEPAMADDDRDRLGDALDPLLRGIRRNVKKSDYWPCYVDLPAEVQHWRDPEMIDDAAFQGKQLDEYVVDLFRNARQTLESVLCLNSIVPTQTGGGDGGH